MSGLDEQHRAAPVCPICNADMYWKLYNKETPKISDDAIGCVNLRPDYAKDYGEFNMFGAHNHNEAINIAKQTKRMECGNCYYVAELSLINRVINAIVLNVKKYPMYRSRWE